MSKKKREDVPSAFRAFPMLSSTGITDVSDRKVGHKIKISPESYSRHRDELMSFDLSSLVKYRAILKSNLSAWQAWSSTLTVFKFTMVGAVCGAIIPMGLSWLFGHLRNWGAISLDIAMVPTAVIVIWLMRSPARIIVKIERATFMLEIVEEVIHHHRHESPWAEVAAGEQMR